MRRLGVLVALATVAFLGFGAAFVLAGGTLALQHNGITICHATGPAKFVEETVDADSILSGHGHGGHEDDIIPPFEVIENGTIARYPGMNLDTLYGDGFTGAEVLANHCEIPAPGEGITGSTDTITVTVPETTTVTVTLPGTTVTIPGEPATTEITVTETIPAVTVTRPGETTTVTVPSGETTTVTVPGETVTLPPVTQTAPGQTVTLPAVIVTAPGATVTLPGVTVTGPGVTITGPGVTQTVPPQTATLPRVTVTAPGQTIDRDPVTVTQPGTTETIVGSGTATVVTVTVPGHALTEGGLRGARRDVITVTTPKRLVRFRPRTVPAIIEYLARQRRYVVIVVRAAAARSGYGKG